MPESRSITSISTSEVHRLCSGQVITSVVSCVKELVENAIDAGATQVDVRLVDAGTTSISVTDNGSGIRQSDYAVVAARHATSKIATFGDIEGVDTWGFRGEALSSLCSLSDVTITTKTLSDPTAHCLSFDHTGTLTNATVAPFGKPSGTIVTSTGLFATLPVRRMELLRKKASSLAPVLHELRQLCVVRPRIRITCTDGTRRVFCTGPHDSTAAVIADVLGVDRASLVHISKDHRPSSSVAVEGFVTRGDQTSTKRASSSAVAILSVNGRLFTSRRLVRAVTEVWKAHSPGSGQCPLMVLALQVPPARLDVNVTPDKRTVFLADEPALVEMVQSATEEAVNSHQWVIGGVQVENKPFSSSSVAAAGPASVHAASPAPASPPSPVTPAKLNRSARADSSPQQTAANAWGQVQYPDGTSAICAEECAPPSPGSSTTPSVRPRQPLHRTAASQVLLESSSDRSSVSLSPSSQGNSLQALQQTATAHRLLLKTPVAAALGASQIPVPTGVAVKRPRALGSSPAAQSSLPAYVSDSSEAFGEDSGSDSATSSVERARRPARDASLSYGASAGDTNFHPSTAEHSSKYSHPRLHGKRRRLPSQSSDAALSEVAALDTAARTSSSSSGSDVECVHFDAALPVSANSRYPFAQHSVSAVCVTSLDEVFAAYNHRQQSAARPTAAAPGCSSSKPNVSGCDTENEITEFVPSSSGDAEACLSRVLHRDSFATMKVVGQFNNAFIIGATVRLPERSSRVDNLSSGPSVDVGVCTSASSIPVESLTASRELSGTIDLFIIDQHAADEKRQFERMATGQMELQRLVVPKILRVSAWDRECLRTYAPVLRQAGFELGFEAVPSLEGARVPPQPDCSVVAEERIRVLTLPVHRGIALKPEDVVEAASLLASGKEVPVVGGTRWLHPKVRYIYATKACKAATKIGDALPHQKMTAIVRGLSSLDHPWACPHGRPTLRYLGATTLPGLTPLCSSLLALDRDMAAVS